METLLPALKLTAVLFGPVIAIVLIVWLSAEIHFHRRPSGKHPMHLVQIYRRKLVEILKHGVR